MRPTFFFLLNNFDGFFIMFFFFNDFDVFIEALKNYFKKKKQNPENVPDVYNKKDNVMYIHFIINMYAVEILNIL